MPDADRTQKAREWVAIDFLDMYVITTDFHRASSRFLCLTLNPNDAFGRKIENEAFGCN